jgi:hypothetical protein
MIVTELLIVYENSGHGFKATAAKHIINSEQKQAA